MIDKFCRDAVVTKNVNNQISQILYDLNFILENISNNMLIGAVNSENDAVNNVINHETGGSGNIST